MPKVIIVHLLGGIFAVAAIEVSAFFAESFRAVWFVAISILIAMYYVFAGYSFRNKSFIKTISVMQTLTFLGHCTYVFGKEVYRFSLVFAGGSAVWNRTTGLFIQSGSLANFLAYTEMFFIFPILMMTGSCLIGKKSVQVNMKNLLKVALCHLVTGTVYLFASWAEKSAGHPLNTGFILLFSGIVCILFLLGGIVLRRTKWSEIYFVMTNISFAGIVLIAVNGVPQYIWRVLRGGEYILNELIKDFGIKHNIAGQLMLFIPPLLVLLGQIAGNKLLRKKEKALENQ